MRTIIAVIIGLIAVYLVNLSIPKQVIAAQGIVLPTSKAITPPTSADNITFYTAPPPGGNFQTIAQVRIMRHYSPSDGDEPGIQIRDLAKTLAAQAGADGVVVRFFAHSDVSSRVPAAQAVYMFLGDAIKKKK